MSQISQLSKLTISITVTVALPLSLPQLPPVPQQPNHVVCHIILWLIGVVRFSSCKITFCFLYSVTCKVVVICNCVTSPQVHHCETLNGYRLCIFLWSFSQSVIREVTLASGCSNRLLVCLCLCSNISYLHTAIPYQRQYFFSPNTNIIPQRHAWRSCSTQSHEQ